MTEPVLEQAIHTADESAEEIVREDAGTESYVQPVVVSFSLDPHGIESGDALTANA